VVRFLAQRRWSRDWAVLACGWSEDVVEATHQTAMVGSIAMSADSTFAEFLRRVRAGDQVAAGQLVRQYEAAIRLEVRLRLRDRRLRRLFDSMDVCQSVLATFFMRASAGQYELNEPHDLLKLLVVIARNKLALQVRQLLSPSRHPGTPEGGRPEAWEVAAPEPGPLEIVADRELVEAFRQRLSEEERYLADLRGQERSWAEIAEQLGGTAQSRRKQLERAVERVLQELNLDEADDA
jgi:RNA polymerase sigma-70 factor (ECF subfamily)